MVYLFRDCYATRRSKRFDSRRDINGVPLHIFFTVNDISQMDSNTKQNPLLWRTIDIKFVQQLLNVESTPECFQGTGEFN